jgi:hypothetical protein
MAEVTGKSNVLIMANGDTYSPVGKRIKIKGVRLVGGSDLSTATISTTEKVIYSMAAQIGAADESCICTQVDGGVLTAALTGTGSSLYVYIE